MTVKQLTSLCSISILIQCIQANKGKLKLRKYFDHGVVNLIKSSVNK